MRPRKQVAPAVCSRPTRPTGGAGGSSTLYGAGALGASPAAGARACAEEGDGAPAGEEEATGSSSYEGMVAAAAAAAASAEPLGVVGVEGAVEGALSVEPPAVGGGGEGGTGSEARRCLLSDFRGAPGSTFRR